MLVTEYDPKELTKLAKEAIREDAKAAHTKARFVRWVLSITNERTWLRAFGQRDDGYVFSVNHLL